MIRAHHVLAPLALITLAACATGCQHEVAVEDESSEGALTAHGATDLPWEVRSRQGETYLPNVFYADASENEQIMPLTVHGRHAIERLVYPTLGNPNLYVKSDPNDEMMTVLRLENGLLDGLGATMGARVEGSKYLRKLEILVDGSESHKYMLQIFLREAAGLYGDKDAGPFFYEIIQRKGDRGFGGGNFRALFESIERQQKSEGRL